MIISIRHEMLVFWMAFLCAQIICAFFDFFRVLRKNTAIGAAAVAIEDAIFVFLAFKIFFDAIYVTNNGHLRWYIFASFAMSAALYFLAESFFIKKLWQAAFDFLRLITSPFCRVIRCFASFVKRMYAKAFLGLKCLVTPAFSRFNKAFFRIWNKFRQNTTKKALFLRRKKHLF